MNNNAILIKRRFCETRMPLAAIKSKTAILVKGHKITDFGVI